MEITVNSVGAIDMVVSAATAAALGPSTKKSRDSTSNRVANRMLSANLAKQVRRATSLSVLRVSNSDSKLQPRLRQPFQQHAPNQQIAPNNRQHQARKASSALTVVSEVSEAVVADVADADAAVVVAVKTVRMAQAQAVTSKAM